MHFPFMINETVCFANAPKMEWEYTTQKKALCKKMLCSRYYYLTPGARQDAGMALAIAMRGRILSSNRLIRLMSARASTQESTQRKPARAEAWPAPRKRVGVEANYIRRDWG